MNQEIYHRAAELFLELSETDEVDRDAWLEAKTDDPEIRQLVVELCIEDERYSAAAKEQPTSVGLGATVTKDGPEESTLTGGEPARLEEFGDYADLVEIGRGGLGVIYRAHQLSLNRTVAIKMIRASADASPAQRLRFCLEAETAAKLEHPNIVPIYEIGSHLDCPFFAMKLIEGPNLSNWLRAGENSIEEKVEIMITVARAIQHAHDNGVLHRDLKPANILIDAQSQPHVTDFGLAKQCEVEVGLTVTGQILGTPSYMPPEQASADNKQVTSAADVYGLGAVLYECLTKEPPFGGPNVYAIMRSVVELEARPANSLNPELDRDLNTICMKCLEKEPSKRYASAEEFALDLERWREGRPIAARPVGAIERGVKWTWRNPAAAGLVAVAVLVVTPLLFAIASLTRSEDERQAASMRSFLVDSVHNVETTELPPVLEALKPFQELAVPELEERLAEHQRDTKKRTNLSLALMPSTPNSVAAFLDSRLDTVDAEVFSIIAQSLMKAGNESPILDRLRASDDPTMRSRIISSCVAAPIDVTNLVNTFSQEKRVGVRRALLQLMRSQDIASVAETDRKTLFSILESAYQNDQDPGVHWACHSVLSEWWNSRPSDSDASKWAEMASKINVSPEQGVGGTAPHNSTPELEELDARIAKLQEQNLALGSTPPGEHARWLSEIVERDGVVVEGDAARFNFDDPSAPTKNLVTGGIGKTRGEGQLEWVSGLIGKALRLTGEATLECNSDFDPDLGQPFSFGCWIQREVREKGGEDEYGAVLSRLTPNGRGGWDLWINNGTLSAHLTSTNNFRNGMAKVAGSDRIPTSTWTHLFVTVDGSGAAEGVHLFLNGQRIEGAAFEPGVSGGSISADDCPVLIGQRNVDLSETDAYPFHGLVEDVRLFERALEPNEIESVYREMLVSVASMPAKERSESQNRFLRERHIHQLKRRTNAELLELQERRARLVLELTQRWYETPEGIRFSVISEPAHPSADRFDYGFAISITPVTVQQFRSFDPNADYDRNAAATEQCPINQVSRHAAAAYCNWLSQREGIPAQEWCYQEDAEKGKFTLRDDFANLRGYRLPTLAEWQYACRASTTTRYFFGEDASLFGRYGWSSENSAGKSHPVGQKLPNDFGLFGMHGGAWEWLIEGARDDSRLAGGTRDYSSDSLRWNLSMSKYATTRESQVTFRVVRTMQ